MAGSLAAPSQWCSAGLVELWPNSKLVKLIPGRENRKYVCSNPKQDRTITYQGFRGSLGIMRRQSACLISHLEYVRPPK